MEVVPIRTVRYRMGAEELLELGRSTGSFAAAQRPFLANRRPFSMGDARLGDLLDIVKDVGGIITGALGFALTTLGDLVSIPLDLLSQGVDLVFTNVAGLLSSIPIVGELLAQILLLGNVAIKFVLSVPGILLHGLGNIMTGISKALLEKNTAAQNQQNTDKAKQDIISKAPPNLQSQVSQVLNSSGMSGLNLTPSLAPGGVPPQAPAGSGLTDVLAYALPAAGVVGAVLLFAK